MRSARALRERLDGIVVKLARDKAAGLPFGKPIDLREEYTAYIPLYTITELMALPDAPRFFIASTVSSQRAFEPCDPITISAPWQAPQTFS